MKNFLILFFFK